MRYILITILFFGGVALKAQGITGMFFHGDSLFLKRSPTDSQCINYRQPMLVSGTNIKTVNGNSLLGSNDINISSAVAWGNVTGTLASQTDLNTALNGKQATITQGTTLQYFRGDFSLVTFPTTTAAFTSSANKNFVTDAQLTVIGNTSGTNTGNQTTISGNAGSATILETARTIAMTGDLVWTSPSFNGSANVTAAGTLATVNGNVGSFGSATQVAGFTVNAKGLVTAASNTSIQIAESQVTSLTTDLGLKANLAGGTFTGPIVFAANQIGVPVYARVTGSNVTTTGQSLADITGLSVALIANATYEIEAVMSVSTSAVTTGTEYGVQYSAAGASVEAQITGASTSTASKTLRISALNTATSAYLTSSAQTGGMTIKGIVTTGANAGNLTIRHLKVTSGTSTVFINSYLKVTRIL